MQNKTLLPRGNTQYPTIGVLDQVGPAAAAYSLRKLRQQYLGPAINVRRDSDNASMDIGFNSNGDLDQNALLNFINISSPLDSVSSAVGAYSVRKIKSGYSGPCMNVRRDSDNTSMDIGFTSSGDLDQVALLAFVGSGNGFVTTWYDQSGNSNDATQNTASLQPHIVSSGAVVIKGSRPAIQQSDPSHYFNVPTSVFSSASSGMGISVFYQTLGGNEGGWGQFTGQIAKTHNPWVDGNSYDGFLSTVRQEFLNYYPPGSALPESINSIVNSGTTLTQYLNGNQIDSAMSVTFNNSTPYSTIFTGYYGISGLSEVILVASSDSATQQLLQNSQSIYYGIPIGSGPSIPTYNGYVTKWYDQSGNGRDFSQSTAMMQPQIVASGIVETQNGVPSVRYNGAQLLNLPQSQAFTLSDSYNVVSADVAAQGSAFWGAYVPPATFPTSRTLGNYTSSANILPISANSGGGYTPDFIEVADGSYGVDSSAANSPYFPSSTLSCVRSRENSPLSGWIYSGGLDFGYSAPTFGYLTGYISEIIFYSYPLTTTILNILSRNQAQYYGGLLVS